MPVETSGVVTVDVAATRAADFARRAFMAVGVPEAEATKAATALVDADLHGVSTHGIKNLAGYVQAVQKGSINSRPEVRVLGGGAAMKQMSGGGGLGHVVSHYGMEQAISLARDYGLGCVFMRESNHYGASGYWARLATKEQMAGFAMTNAAASIAPWGGTQPLLGNNPPAWALPSRMAGTADDADTLDPVFLDMALSVVAGNRLDIYHRRGQPIPLGWALDKDGQPTTNARARQTGGSYAPIAEYKGYGLALVLSLFTSLLAGGPFDYDQGRADMPQPGRCHWFMAFDVAQITSLETFTGRVREIAERVRTSPPKVGVDRIYVPGDIENERARRQLAAGIAYERFVLDDLRALAGTLDLRFDLV